MIRKTEEKESEKKVTKTEQQFLKCVLTEEEVAQAAGELAREVENLKELEEALGSIKAEFKGKTEKAEANISIKARLVRDKHEYRNVECDVTYDYSACDVTVTRKDTGEIIETRKMTYNERQTTMEFGKE